MAIFSLGNKKIPRSTAIFNIPRLLTCPWATPMCRKVCYAKKAERRFFFRCLPQRTRNLHLTQRKDFVEIISQELQKLNKNRVRVHESGDFYSQEYLDKWFEIMNRFPYITFIAYSKAMLDFSKKPNNFILLFSMDNSTPTHRKEWYEINPYKNALAFIDNEKADCPGSCKECSRCYDVSTVRDVYFHQH